jgi:hypothetical protein
VLLAIASRKRITLAGSTGAVAAERRLASAEMLTVVAALVAAFPGAATARAVAVRTLGAAA